MPRLMPRPSWLWITATASSFHFGFILDHPEEIGGMEAEAKGLADVVGPCDIACDWLEEKLTDDGLLHAAAAWQRARRC